MILDIKSGTEFSLIAYDNSRKRKISAFKGGNS